MSCVVAAALQLLHAGKVRMAIVVLEQALQAERSKPVKAPAPRARKTGGRP